MEYFYKKPIYNLYLDKQLFAEDCNKSGAKKWFYSDHKTIFDIIRFNNKTLHLYEDQTYCDFIKLHFDIDYIKTYEYKLLKKEEAKKIINCFIPKVINKIKQHFSNLNINPQYIVYMSDGLAKLSLHIIFTNVYFKSIIDMKFFCSDFELIDQLIYRKGCFRLPLCSKFGKSNKLKFLMSTFSKHPNPAETFLSSCISYYRPDSSNIIFDRLSFNQLLNFKSISTNINIYYYFYLGIEEIANALNKIDLSDYAIWLAVTSSIKDLYTNIKATDEQKQHIYNLYDIACSKYPKYNPIENKKIFDKLEQFFDINYLFYLADSNYKIIPSFNLELIAFNEKKYPQANIQTQFNTYIAIDYDELIKNKTIYIKSATGTGKTRILKSIIEKLNCESILSITSRTNLAGEHLNDLDLKFYKHMNYHDFSTCSRVAIQLESLYKIDYELFENGIIILDEINSFLSHFRSPTVEDKRTINFKYFVELITSAKYVICLDADLCDWNIEFINKIRDKSNYLIYYNKIKNKVDIPSTFYSDQNVMISKMVTNIQESKYFVACFDSLTYMKKVINYLSCFEDECNFLIYSSETNTELVDTSKWINKYVFYTPSIIYGISYDLSCSEVFSFTIKSHLNSFQIYQMINRTRLLTHVHVYCNPDCNIPKHKYIQGVENDFNILEKNALKYIDVNDVCDYEQLYKFIYINTTYIDQILKSNTSYYLINIMANLGFNIKFDYTTNSNIKLDSVKYTKRDIKDNIINIFGLEKNSLNKFQTKLFESSTLLEKHFNLRSYYKNTLDDKLSMNIQKAMLSESLKNRYLKIKMAIKFMNELGYNTLEDIKYEGKDRKRLCIDCTTNIITPKDIGSLIKSRWCNPIIKKINKMADLNNDTKKSTLNIYSNIIAGKTSICQKCQRLLNNELLINKDILYSQSNFSKYTENIKSDWIMSNLEMIFELFDLNKNDCKSTQYYRMYQIMIGLFKNLFGYDLFETERIHITTTEYYYFYSVNIPILEEHKQLINILDNKYICSINSECDSDCDSDVIDE